MDKDLRWKFDYKSFLCTYYSQSWFGMSVGWIWKILSLSLQIDPEKVLERIERIWETLLCPLIEWEKGDISSPVKCKMSNVRDWKTHHSVMAGVFLDLGSNLIPGRQKCLWQTVETLRLLSNIVTCSQHTTAISVKRWVIKQLVNDQSESFGIQTLAHGTSVICIH